MCLGVYFFPSVGVVRIGDGWLAGSVKTSYRNSAGGDLTSSCCCDMCVWGGRGGEGVWRVPLSSEVCILYLPVVPIAWCLSPHGDNTTGITASCFFLLRKMTRTGGGWVGGWGGVGYVRGGVYVLYVGKIFHFSFYFSFIFYIFGEKKASRGQLADDENEVLVVCSRRPQKKKAL